MTNILDNKIDNVVIEGGNKDSIGDKKDEILTNLTNQSSSKRFEMTVSQEGDYEKIIKEEFYKNLEKEKIIDAIQKIHQKIEGESLISNIEKNPDWIYNLKDLIVLKGNISSKEYVLEIQKRGQLKDFLQEYKEAVEIQINKLTINKDIQENFDIDYWSQDFYVFDPKDQTTGMTDQDTPTKFMHDSCLVSDGKSTI